VVAWIARGGRLRVIIRFQSGVFTAQTGAATGADRDRRAYAGFTEAVIAVHHDPPISGRPSADAAMVECFTGQ
jgi:hypothetical protein